MSRRIDLLAGAVILVGAGVLGRPATAYATYLNPWDRAVDSAASTIAHDGYATLPVILKGVKRQ